MSSFIGCPASLAGIGLFAWRSDQVVIRARRRTPFLDGQGLDRSVALTRSLIIQLVIGLFAGCADIPTAVAPPGMPPTPRFLIVPSGFIQISDYDHDACAVRTDGKLTCWGLGYYFRNFPPAGTFTQVSAGYEASCGIRTEGSLACWGSTYTGQTNAPAGTFSQVSVGSNPCAISTDGTLACWGNGHADPPSGTFTQLSSGGGHSCAVRTDQTVACWGSDISSDDGFPVAGKATPPEGTFTQVSAGNTFTCGLRTDGTIACWGSIRNYAPITPPTGVFTQIAAGTDGACALRVNGSIACWHRDVGQQSPPSTGIYTQIVVGDEEVFRSCALRDDSVIVCWGSRTSPNEPTNHVAPTATFTATPRSLNAGSSFTLRISGAHVLNYPEATSFTYKFDCGDGNGFSIASPDSVRICSTSITESGYRNPQGKVYDQDGDVRSNGFGAVQVTGNTPTGNGVAVTPVDATTGAPSPIQLTFDSVGRSGSTTVTSSTIGAGGSPPPPSGFQLGDPPTFYDIASSSSFVYSVAVCINYSGVSFSNESELKLLHYVDGAWVDITSVGYPNTTTKQLCGATASFSPFVIAQLSVSQAINFAAPTSPALLSTNAALSATGGASGNVVVFSSLTPGVCGVSGLSVSYLSIGTCTVAANQAAGGAYLAAPQITHSVAVIWPFTGFTKPTANPPALNFAQGGSTVVVKFGLGADRGLAVLAAGSTTSMPISCTSRTPTGPAVPANGTVTYDTQAGIYGFAWKTDKTYGRTCRQLTVVLADGTRHAALLSFK